VGRNKSFRICVTLSIFHEQFSIQNIPSGARMTLGTAHGTYGGGLRDPGGGAVRGHRRAARPPEHPLRPSAGWGSATVSLCGTAHPFYITDSLIHQVPLFLK
jgi:hypothetical protein